MSWHNNTLARKIKNDQPIKNKLPSTERALCSTHPDFYSKYDEIDLFELFEKLLKEKFLILGTTFLGGVAAIAIALLLPKTFSSEAVVNQAAPAQLARLNLVAPLIKQPGGFETIISPDRVYDKYRTKLTSFDTQQFAFSKSLLAREAQQKNTENPDRALTLAFNSFRDNLKISFDSSKKNTTQRITIRYESTSPEETASMINEVVLPYVRSRVIDELEDDRRAIIEQERAHIRKTIASREFAFLNNNQLLLTELEEALVQAKAADIHTLQTSEVKPTMMKEAQYLLGTSLITARIEVIKKRINQYHYFSNTQSGDEEKPYIRGVADKIETLNQLNNVSSDFTAISPVVIEQNAVVPILPIKPRKKFIVALGVIAGGMLGVFIALIRIATRNRKEKAGSQFPATTFITMNHPRPTGSGKREAGSNYRI